MYLTHGVRAEVNGGTLVDLLDGTLVDVGHLNTASAKAALTPRALQHQYGSHVNPQSAHDMSFLVY